MRVKALLKRSGVILDNKIKYRDLSLDISKRELYINKISIELTNLEFNLLYIFIKNPNTILDRDLLRDEVWGEDSISFNEKTINVTINRLKKKIDPSGEKNYFVPVRGVGYKMI